MASPDVSAGCEMESEVFWCVDGGEGIWGAKDVVVSSTGSVLERLATVAGVERWGRFASFLPIPMLGVGAPALATSSSFSSSTRGCRGFNSSILAAYIRSEGCSEMQSKQGF